MDGVDDAGCCNDVDDDYDEMTDIYIPFRLLYENKLAFVAMKYTSTSARTKSTFTQNPFRFIEISGDSYTRILC